MSDNELLKELKEQKAETVRIEKLLYMILEELKGINSKLRDK